MWRSQNVIQFNRIASIQIGKIKGEGIEIKNLRLSFNVKKTGTEEFNDGNVSIYNLSESTRNKIKDLDDVLVIKAGYESLNNEQVIFVGNITQINTLYDSKPDILTIIEARDGVTSIRQLRLSVSYKNGTSAKKVLKDILNKTGLPLKNFEMSSIIDKQYVNGFSFVGMGRVLLNNVCLYLGLDWSIQNDEIKLQRTGMTDETKIVQLSASSGLIGSPERVLNISHKSKQKNAIKGWKIKSLLMPQIEPGNLIFVQSKEIPIGATFKVIEVHHIGDTHGNDWTTEMVTVIL